VIVIEKMAKKKQMEYIRDAWAPFNAMNEPRHTQTPACPIKKEKWIHDNKELLFGSVMYKVKFLGIVDSETCEDRLTVEEAFRELKRKGINKSTDVEMSISVRAVIVTEVKSKACNEIHTIIMAILCNIIDPHV
jgi:hypothetical protein